jgi:hypothetical protein
VLTFHLQQSVTTLDGKKQWPVETSTHGTSHSSTPIPLFTSGLNCRWPQNRNAHQQLKRLRPSLFWVVMQCRFVFGYRRFGTAYRSQFKGYAVQEPWRLDRYVVPKTSVTNYKPTSQTSHTSDSLQYTVTKAYYYDCFNLSVRPSAFRLCRFPSISLSFVATIRTHHTAHTNLCVKCNFQARRRN